MCLWLPGHRGRRGKSRGKHGSISRRTPLLAEHNNLDDDMRVVHVAGQHDGGIEGEDSDLPFHLPDLANMQPRDRNASATADAFFAKQNPRRKKKAEEKKGFPNPLKIVGKVLRAFVQIMNNRVINFPWWGIGFLLMGYSRKDGDDEDRYMGSCRWTAGMVVYSMSWTLNVAIAVAVLTATHKLEHHTSLETLAFVIAWAVAQSVLWLVIGLKELSVWKDKKGSQNDANKVMHQLNKKFLLAFGVKLADEGETYKWSYPTLALLPGLVAFYAMQRFYVVPPPEVECVAICDPTKEECPKKFMLVSECTADANLNHAFFSEEGKKFCCFAETPDIWPGLTAFLAEIGGNIVGAYSFVKLFSHFMLYCDDSAVSKEMREKKWNEARLEAPATLELSGYPDDNKYARPDFAELLFED